jgi:hypothetical protein
MTKAHKALYDAARYALIMPDQHARAYLLAALRMTNETDVYPRKHTTIESNEKAFEIADRFTEGEYRDYYRVEDLDV